MNPNETGALPAAVDIAVALTDPEDAERRSLLLGASTAEDDAGRERDAEEAWGPDSTRAARLESSTDDPRF